MKAYLCNVYVHPVFKSEEDNSTLTSYYVNASRGNGDATKRLKGFHISIRKPWEHFHHVIMNFPALALQYLEMDWKCTRSARLILTLGNLEVDKK